MITKEKIQDLATKLFVSNGWVDNESDVTEARNFNLFNEFNRRFSDSKGIKQLRDSSYENFLFMVAREFLALGYAAIWQQTWSFTPYDELTTDDIDNLLQEIWEVGANEYAFGPMGAKAKESVEDICVKVQTAESFLIGEDNLKEEENLTDYKKAFYNIGLALGYKFCEEHLQDATEGNLSKTIQNVKKEEDVTNIGSTDTEQQFAIVDIARITSAKKSPKPRADYQSGEESFHDFYFQNLSNIMDYGEAMYEWHKNHNDKKLYEVMQTLEDDGFGEASLEIGQYCLATDPGKAFEHFFKAAKSGVAYGAWECSKILGKIAKDETSEYYNNWYELLHQAAKGGCCPAMKQLSELYLIKDDYLAAFYWQLKGMYYDYWGKTAAPDTIIQKWIKAGKPQLSATIYRIGSKDVESAKEIFNVVVNPELLDQKMMDRFMALAMEDDNEIMGLFIGNFFETEVQIPENAVLGYQLAAHNNSIKGMSRLGELMYEGKGCSKDVDTAMLWLEYAAYIGGDKKASEIMDRINRRFDPQEADFWQSIAKHRTE